MRIVTKVVDSKDERCSTATGKLSMFDPAFLPLFRQVMKGFRIVQMVDI